MARNLPQNIEAEQALLGTVIVYPSAMTACLDNGLQPEDFFTERHQKIYQALADLYNEKKPTDFTSLLARLKDQKLMEDIGGVDYLSQLSDSVVSGYSAKHYIDLIQEKALLRRLILVSQDIMKESFDNSFESDEVLDKAERLILEVTQARKTSDFREIAEVTNKVIDNITELSKLKGNPTGVRTGIKRLDTITHGLQKSDLIILAARPSIGKTALALNIGLNAAMSGSDPVALFSLEMPAELLTRRMLACSAGVEISKLRNAFLNNTEWTRLNEAASNMQELPIWIDDSPIIKMSEITAKCRKLQHNHGLGLVVIDYLQLIYGGGRSESRQQEVSEISRRLKALARELNVPVIALSQLSRAGESKAENPRAPRLSDLRESGSIEQDADIVMFLYNEDGNGDEHTAILNVDIAKHRNGPTTDFKLQFAKDFNKFFDFTEEEVKEKSTYES